MNGLVCRPYLPLFTLTWTFSFITLEILAAQAFKQVRAQAYTLSIQQSQSAPVQTRLALAHVVVGHIVCYGPLQVGYPGVSVRHFQWDQHIDGLRLSGMTE